MSRGASWSTIDQIFLAPLSDFRMLRAPDRAVFDDAFLAVWICNEGAAKFLAVLACRFREVTRGDGAAVSLARGLPADDPGRVSDVLSKQDRF